MMTAGREELEIAIKAQDEASKVFRDVDNNAKKMSKGVSKSIGDIKAGTLAAVAAFTSLAGKFKSTATEVDRTVKAARRMQVGFEFLQVLEFQASQTGVSVETISVAMNALTRRLGEAQRGNEAFAQAFRRLGVDFNAHKGAANEVELVYRDIIARMSEVKSAAEQAAIADGLMSEAGRKLVSVLADGTEGLAKFTNNAKKMGLVVTEQTAVAIETLNDKLDQAERRLNSFMAKGLSLYFQFFEQVKKGATQLGKDTGLIEPRIKLSDSAQGAIDEGPERARRAAMLKWMRELQRSQQELNRSTARFFNSDFQDEGAKAIADAFADIDIEAEDLVVTIDEADKKMLDLETRLVDQAVAAEKGRLAWMEYASTVESLSSLEARSDALFDQAIEEQRDAVNEALRSHEEQARQTAQVVAGTFETVFGSLFNQIEQGEVKLAEIGKNVLRLLSSFALRGASNAFSSIFSAKGNVFEGGDVVPFAKGGVINGPIGFPLKSGMGIAGEAGPEAIMPLKRGPGGRLGVESSGGGGGVMNVNIQAVDAGSFVKLAQENPEALAQIVSAAVSSSPNLRNNLRTALN